MLDPAPIANVLQHPRYWSLLSAGRVGYMYVHVYALGWVDAKRKAEFNAFPPLVFCRYEPMLDRRCLCLWGYVPVSASQIPIRTRAALYIGRFG